MARDAATRWAEVRDRFNNILAIKPAHGFGDWEWTVRKSLRHDGHVQWQVRGNGATENREQLAYAARCAGELLLACPPSQLTDSTREIADAEQRWWIFVGVDCGKFRGADDVVMVAIDNDGKEYIRHTTVELTEARREAERACDSIARQFEDAATGADVTPEAATATPAKVNRIRSRNCRPAKAPPKKLTERQTESLRLHGECNGNMSEVARRMGITHPAARQHYDAANKKLGITLSEQARTTRLAAEQHGQGVKGLPARRRGKGVKVDD